MALLVFGSLVNLSETIILGLVFQDKLIHFTAFAILCFVIFFLFVINKIKNSLKKAIAAAIIFGTVIEILQVTLTNYRAFEFHDIAANTVGILTMGQIIRLKKLSIVKKLESLM